MLRDAEQTKAKILEAAVAEFTSRGFHGARVAQIADRAGVNVSLLYRYFGSKEQLLHTILCGVIEGAQPGGVEAPLDQSLASTLTEFRTLLGWAWEQLAESRDLIKIVLLESHESEVHKDLSVQFLLARVLERMPPELREQWDDEALQTATAICFFGLIPLLAFVLYQEQWATKLGIEPEQAREHFFEAFEEVYMRFFVSQLRTGLVQAPREVSE